MSVPHKMWLAIWGVLLLRHFLICFMYDLGIISTLGCLYCTALEFAFFPRPVEQRGSCGVLLFGPK